MIRVGILCIISWDIMVRILGYYGEEWTCSVYFRVVCNDNGA